MPTNQRKRITHIVDLLDKATESITEPSKVEKTERSLSRAYELWVKTGHNDIALNGDLYNLQEHFGDHYPDDDSEDDDERSYDFLADEVVRIKGIAQAHLNNLPDVASSSDQSSDSDSDEETDDETAAENPTRQRLSEEFEGYVDAEEATNKRKLRDKSSENHFFDPSRNKKPRTETLTTTFYNNRRTKQKTTAIATDLVSARSLITAETAAVARAVENIEPEQIETKDGIKKHLGWNLKKKNNWNREQVTRGHKEVKKELRPTAVNYQFQPSAGNLSNFKMDGVGRYGVGAAGKIPNILQVIDSITDKKVQKEKDLAKLMIKFSAKGKFFTAKNLYQAKLALAAAKPKRDQQIAQLNRLSYLVCIKEISRRKNQGFKKVDGELVAIEELPFGIAIAKALLLLRDGHLRMKQVFDENSPFGVFSGKEIMSKRNFDKTQKKFAAVDDLYNKSYGGDAVKEFLAKHPTGKVVAVRETNHKVLLEVCGGNSDTSGDEYESSDEETERLERVYRLRGNV